MSRDNEPKDNPFMPDPSSMDITDQQFMELCEMTVQMVNTVAFSGKEKSLMPVVFVHHRRFVEGNMLSDIEHTIVVIGQGFNDADEKRSVMKKIGAKFFDEKLFPVAIFMASEAWMSMINLKDRDKKDFDISKLPLPSKDPNRKECIMIAGKTTSGDCNIGIMIPIKRDENEYMQRDGEETRTKELETYLLNQFFHGFFHKIANKYTEEEKLDMVSKYRNRSKT